MANTILPNEWCTLEGLAQATGDYQRANPTHPFTDAMRLYGVISFAWPDEELATQSGIDLGGYVGLSLEEQQRLKASAMTQKGAQPSLREMIIEHEQQCTFRFDCLGVVTK